MGDTIRLVSPDGEQVIEVPIAQAGIRLDQGWHSELAPEALTRVSGEAKEATYGGIGGKIQTGIGSALSAATLGGTDALIAALDPQMAEDIKAGREVNPGSALVGNIVGAGVGLLPGAGFLPGGAVSKIAGRIAGAGEGAGLATRAAYTAGGAAFEGAAQNAGAYVSDVALGDRELSAEGFAGAVGQGAFWGGTAGGGLTLAAGGLTAARRLFPKVEMSAANVAKVEREAVDEIGRAVDDGATLEHSATERIREISTERAMRDPEFAAKVSALKDAKARELAARVDTAEAKAVTAEERAWQAKQKAAEVRDGGKATRKTRKAMQEGEGEAVPTRADSASPTPTPLDAPQATTPMTALEQQLLGTKKALDAGEALKNIGPRRTVKPALVDDAMEEIAKVDPEARALVDALSEMRASRGVVDEWLGKYGGKESQVGRFERSQAARDYAEGMRPKESGYYANTPAGEGNAFLARGKEFKFRGTDEERKLADEAINARVPAEERVAIDEMMAKRRAGKIADDVTAPEPVTVDDQVSGALKSKVKDINEDIAENAPALSRYENATADMTDALGPRAPVSAQDRAAAFRTAQQNAEGKAATAAGDAAADIENAAATISLPGAPGKGGVLGQVQTGGDLWQALHMMGVPLPDPKDVPVVGPLLSMYLKARVLGKAFGRFGGKVAQTAETVVATKAAATKQRVYAAVDKLLETTSRGVAKTAPKVGGVAAVLGHSLFDPRSVGDERPEKAKKGDLAGLYHERAAELVAAMAPGAIRTSVRAKVRVTDPELLDAIVAAKEKKLAYLHETMPKADQPPGLLTGATEWTPNKPALASWTRRIAAAEDPASVLETAAAGEAVSIEAAETLKQVYPRLYQEAQMRLLDKVTDGTARTIPYARRLQLSMLFGLPLDGSQQPEMAAFLQASYKPPPPAMPAQAPPLTPTVASDVRSAARNDPAARTRP